MKRAVVAAVFGVSAVASAPAAAASAGLTAASAGLTAGPATAAGERVVLVGIPGLMWSDVTPADTPNLWRLAGDSAVGSLSVRAVRKDTCPYDAWLTVSAGVRSAVGERAAWPPRRRPTARGR
ncbi:hypothetical protein GCM10027612_60160 [Microbispora bryophytorum subsp. camponoti]